MTNQWCPYAVGTTSFLAPANNYTENTSRDFFEKQLTDIAKILDIDPTLPTNIICEQIQKIVPSEDWFIANFTASRDLSLEVRNFIINYTSYSYDRINGYLRSGNDEEMQLNNAIDSLPPIDRDIYVMRYIDKNSVFLPERGEFLSLGYLSTSIDFGFYVNVRKHPNWFKDQTLLRIRVPRGQKALWIPSGESELLFKHGIVLEVIAHYEKPILIGQNIYYIDFYDMLMK